jgi:HEAT repeat protein
VPRELLSLFEAHRSQCWKGTDCSQCTLIARDCLHRAKAFRRAICFEPSRWATAQSIGTGPTAAPNTHVRPRMNCTKQKSQRVCQNLVSGEFILAVWTQILSGALLWLLSLFPATGLAETAAVEVQAAVEASLQPSTQPRAALSQVVEGLIRKHGRETVADAAIKPLTAALTGTNYQGRESAAWGLLELKDPRAVEPLIEFLHMENLGDWGAEKALIVIGEPVVGPLVVAFQSGKSNPHFLHKAARVLGELKDVRAVGPLLEVFAIKDSSLPWVFAEALGNIGGAEAVDGLIAALKSGTPAMKMNSAKALGKIKDPRAVPALLDALGDPDRALRSEAAFALGEIGDPAAIDGLVKALADPKLGTEREASIALGKLRNSGAAEVMLRHFREAKNPVERAVLLRTLAQMGEPAVDVMIATLKDDDADIRATALQQLSALSTPGYVVAQNLTEASGQRAREAILDYYDTGKADGLRFPERVSILAGIKNARAVRLILRTLKTKEEGYEDCPWYVPQDIYLAFEKAGSYSVDPLLEGLDDPDVNIRAGSAAMLGHIPINFFGTSTETTASRIIERLGKAANDSKEHEAVRENALCAISRMGDARQAPLLVVVLEDKTAPVSVRRAAARAFLGEKLQDRGVTVSLMAVFRDKSENQSLRVETASTLQSFEHKYQDPQIVEAFNAVKMDRSEPAAVRAAARTTRQLLDRIKAQSDTMMAASKARQQSPAQELPYGKKPWPQAAVKSFSIVAERTLVESQGDGERQEVKSWYDTQFADWNVYKEWNRREITVMMNGEWKVWSNQNTCCLVVIHDKERRGGMTLVQVFDREEELQELLAEIPEDLVHRERCRHNLQVIESAKGQAARKLKLATGSVVETGKLSTLIPGGYESLVCPDAGTYTIGALGKPSRCSVHGTQMAIGRR